ncbi:MAG TPA: penicillin-binding protein 1C, partial [Bacteroidetes bacterium]|nr:penicillin-binding protein 1C [Bacteroidota bacterium]
MKLTLKHVYRLGKICLVGFCLFFLIDLLFPFQIKIDYSTVIKDREGNILSCYLSKDQQWRFLFEDEDFNDALTKAFIQKEDKYFYYHFGINPFAICRAFVNNVIYGKKTSGASTITMQVCRMLNRKPRTYSNKLAEMWKALQMEWHYSKKDILRLYLSLVPYGGNIQGVKSASIIFFQKEPQALSSAQIAALCLIPNRPNTLGFGKNDALLIKERNKWIKRFHKEGLYNKEVMNNALKEPLDNYKRSVPRNVPHFCRRMKNKFSKPVINT